MDNNTMLSKAMCFLAWKMQEEEKAMLTLKFEHRQWREIGLTLILSVVQSVNALTLKFECSAKY
jgi:hypothetical protein